MTDAPQSFLTDADQALAERFLADGFVVVEAEDRGGLDRIRALAAGLAAKHLKSPMPDDVSHFLDRIHEKVDAVRLNDLRLTVIGGLNAAAWLRPAYYGLARSALAAICGNELAMQRRLNLSIQLPGDESSLLPVHADVWAGDSPFEVVLWVPLVDCHDTKSMFLLPPEPDRAARARWDELGGKSTEDLFQAIEADLEWLSVPYGKVVVFSQTLMHGNRVNREKDSRWSMNCRFKGVFSPYGDKKLGEFFEPITLRAASRMGLDYEFPGGGLKVES